MQPSSPSSPSSPPPKAPQAPKAAVLGDPIAHSLSPRLHTHWLQQAGLQGTYEAIRVAPTPHPLAALTETLDRLEREGYKGVNITIPYKNVAFDIATVSARTVVRPNAAWCGAVNALTFTPDGREVDNTDVTGMIACLDDGCAHPSLGQPSLQTSSPLQPHPYPRRHGLIMGTGGTANAVLVAMIQRGIPRVSVMTRNVESGRSMVASILQRTPSTTSSPSWPALNPNNLTNTRVDVIPRTDDGIWSLVDVVVNATPLGMDGFPDHEAAVLDGLAHAARTARRQNVIPLHLVDAVYRTKPTQLVMRAVQEGAITTTGHWMLAYQAAPCFRRWFGGDPHVTKELVERVLLGSS